MVRHVSAQIRIIQLKRRWFCGQGGAAASVEASRSASLIPDLLASPWQLRQLRIMFPGTIHINVLHYLVGLICATCF